MSNSVWPSCCGWHSREWTQTCHRSRSGTWTCSGPPRRATPGPDRPTTRYPGRPVTPSQTALANRDQGVAHLVGPGRRTRAGVKRRVHHEPWWDHRRHIAAPVNKPHRPGRLMRSGATPVVCSGNSHDVGAAGDRRMMFSLTPCRRRRQLHIGVLAYASIPGDLPSTAGCTSAAPSTPKPTDTPSPRSSRAKSVELLNVANESLSSEAVGVHRGSLAPRRRVASTGVIAPCASGTNASPGRSAGCASHPD